MSTPLTEDTTEGPSLAQVSSETYGDIQFRTPSLLFDTMKQSFRSVRSMSDQPFATVKPVASVGP